ncbi:hypothetical protein BDZ91DRAFT_741743 [Kalaharituber pfeilii]|nr:hypothetical protein BDZ91DRAFT_741743 [Kalaharituber pfeilii]
MQHNQLSVKVRVTSRVHNNRNSRSIARFQGDERAVVEEAARLIKLHTLFKDPLPDLAHTAMIIEQLWEEAQSNTGVKMDKDDKIEGYLRSIQSRTRSYLLHEIKKNIDILYGFADKPSTFIRVHVRRLMEGDCNVDGGSWAEVLPRGTVSLGIGGGSAAMGRGLRRRRLGG